MKEKEPSMIDLINSNKNKNIYWPYIIKLNQFNKIINDKKISIRLGLTSENNLFLEYYREEDPNNSFYKTSLNISEIQNINAIFKSKQKIEEIYDDIYEVLNKQNFDIKYPDNPDESNKTIFLVLLYDKKEINITLNKEKISFLNEYNYELNDFINKLYDEVLNLKKILNNKKNEENEKIKKLMEENLDCMKKLSISENKNVSQENEINSLKKTISELKNKNNISKTSSKNYLKKQDVISNYVPRSSNEEDYDDNLSNNANPYFNYIPDYYNGSFNYYNFLYIILLT